MHNCGCRYLGFLHIPPVGLPGKVEVLFACVKNFTRFHRILRYVRVRVASYIVCALLSYHVIEVVK